VCVCADLTQVNHSPNADVHYTTKCLRGLHKKLACTATAAPKSKILSKLWACQTRLANREINWPHHICGLAFRFPPLAGTDTTRFFLFPFPRLRNRHRPLAMFLYTRPVCMLPPLQGSKTRILNRVAWRLLSPSPRSWPFSEVGFD